MTAPFYCALVHHPVVDRSGEVVTTAITNLDVHDLARSARTYGAAGFFVVTPITAQRAIVDRILLHWREGPGARKLPERGEALELCIPTSSLEDSITRIEEREGSRPWLLLTSASLRDESTAVDETSVRRRLAESEQPLLIAFGTGHGLAPEVYRRAEAVLRPIRAGRYNHLSVRAAAAITLDRIFGE